MRLPSTTNTIPIPIIAVEHQVVTGLSASFQAVPLQSHLRAAGPKKGRGIPPSGEYTMEKCAETPIRK